MTNAIVPATFGALSSRFAKPIPGKNELSAGIQSGFGHIGYKGKVWSIRHRGESKDIMRPDGDGPANSIEVVIVKGSAAISKIWYEKGFVEGSSAAPDCFSSNGVTPDAASAKPQCNVCARCPKNAWGSKVTAQGKAGKACSDSKRLAVVPSTDIENKLYGGPMLLRVPAASLSDLASYGDKMDKLGYPSYAVATRISFDATQAYPKFIFGAIRPLNDAEADLVLAMRDGIEVSRILSEASDVTPAGNPEAAVQAAFEQPVATQPQVAQAAVTGQTPVQTPHVQATVTPPAALQGIVLPPAEGLVAHEAQLDAEMDALLPQ